MPRVEHFEIPADDPERAVKFYEDAFGWEIRKWEGPMEYWLVMTGDKSEPGIDGGITKRGDVKTVTNTIGVPSVDDFIGKIEAAGWFAYCADTEGNLFGIMESDRTAK